MYSQLALTIRDFKFIILLDRRQFVSVTLNFYEKHSDYSKRDWYELIEWWHESHYQIFWDC